MAKNEKCPLKILYELSKSEYHNVRLAVAKNRIATIEILYELVYDISEEVREAVAKHNKSLNLCGILKGDKSIRVQNALKDHPERFRLPENSNFIKRFKLKEEACGHCGFPPGVQPDDVMPSSICMDCSYPIKECKKKKQENNDRMEAEIRNAHVSGYAEWVKRGMPRDDLVRIRRK